MVKHFLNCYKTQRIPGVLLLLMIIVACLQLLYNLASTSHRSTKDSQTFGSYVITPDTERSNSSVSSYRDAPESGLINDTTPVQHRQQGIPTANSSTGLTRKVVSTLNTRYFVHTKPHSISAKSDPDETHVLLKETTVAKRTMVSPQEGREKDTILENVLTKILKFDQVKNMTMMMRNQTAETRNQTAETGIFFHGVKADDQTGKVTSTAVRPGTKTDQKQMLRKRAITLDCNTRKDASGIKTPFKFYIYSMPAEFNLRIVDYFDKDDELLSCYHLHHCGMGPEFYKTINEKPMYQKPFFKGRQLKQVPENQRKPYQLDYNLSIRDTNMFSLEVIIHHKLLHSPYRTLDPDKADMFYIPAYFGLQCLGKDQRKENTRRLVTNMFKFLHQYSYFKQGKPHFSTLGKVQREEFSRDCPYLLHPFTRNITYIGIEEENNPDVRKYRKVHTKPMVVAPYPSYVHFAVTQKNHGRGIQNKINITRNPFLLKTPALKNRNVFLFIAVGHRQSTLFRDKIKEQFDNKTEDSYIEYLQNNSSPVSDVLLFTDECYPKHRNTTIEWMQHSVFCLQPPGDSPTRKSIYDSILSGCIPVIFAQRYSVKYPFQQYLNYSEFTYTIHEDLVEKRHKKVLDILRSIPLETVSHLHQNILRVAKWFQYSIPDGSILKDDDAMVLIMKELGEKLLNITAPM